LSVSHSEGHRSLLKKSYTDVIIPHPGPDRESSKERKTPGT